MLVIFLWLIYSSSKLFSIAPIMNDEEFMLVLGLFGVIYGIYSVVGEGFYNKLEEIQQNIKDIYELKSKITKTEGEETIKKHKERIESYKYIIEQETVAESIKREGKKGVERSLAGELTTKKAFLSGSLKDIIDWYEREYNSFKNRKKEQIEKASQRSFVEASEVYESLWLRILNEESKEKSRIGNGNTREGVVKSIYQSIVEKLASRTKAKRDQSNKEVYEKLSSCY